MAGVAVVSLAAGALLVWDGVAAVLSDEQGGARTVATGAVRSTAEAPQAPASSRDAAPTADTAADTAADTTRHAPAEIPAATRNLRRARTPIDGDGTQHVVQARKPATPRPESPPDIAAPATSDSAALTTPQLPAPDAPPPTEPAAASPTSSSPALPAGVQADAEAAAITFTLIQRSRDEFGIARLQRNPNADRVAQRWAEQLAADRSLRHNPVYGTQLRNALGDGRAGENVGRIGRVDPVWLHAAFLESEGHLANIVGDFTHVGVGAARSVDGSLWVVHNFFLPS